MSGEANSLDHPEGQPDIRAESTLLPQHAQLISASAITPEVARARGYRSATSKAELARLGFGPSQQIVPTLVLPIFNVQGELALYQHRPDAPRMRDGKLIKYETPRGSHMVLDVPPPARPWLGDPNRPLVVTEGARKADSAVSRGLCCVSLLGVWSWRGSNGDGGRVALPDWEVIALNGRRVYVVFDSDVMTKREVAGALGRHKAFLESRGAEVRMIYLPPGAGGAKQGLDNFLAAGHSVDELLALATERLHYLPAEPTDTGPYRVEGGRLCREKATRDGPILEPLCNFTATVTEEIILDDGVEQSRAFLVQGRLDTGESLPSVRILASRFAGMNWVTEHWGLRAVIRAGQATRDYLREAIQRLSPAALRRHLFTHTGWTEINGASVYLTACGAVGRDGVEVDLGPELTRYRLPRHAEDPVGAIRLSLRLLRVAPLSVTIPLWAAIYRAPLTSLLPVDVSVWLEGQTGSLKSTIAALALAHYGDFDRLHLPGAWASTVNHLERRAFVLKDTVFVVDDYAPSGADARDLELKAARLLRSQGNLSGRGRLRADLSERPAFVPRGVIVVTGEQHPPGQSILARVLLVELRRDDVNLAALAELQHQATRLPHALSAYVSWLAPQWPELPERLRQAFEGARARATRDGSHLRVPEALAHMWIGFVMGLCFVEEMGACAAAEAQELRDQGWSALLTCGHAQGQLVETERPSRRFLGVLRALVDQRKALLLPRDDAEQHVRPGLDLIGWQDDHALFLIPEVAYTVVSRFCREAGEPFAVRSSRLLKDLAQEGLSECDSERHTTTAKIAGRSKRVLKLHRAAVTALLGEDFPSPVVTGVTGFGE